MPLKKLNRGLQRLETNFKYKVVIFILRFYTDV